MICTPVLNTERNSKRLVPDLLSGLMTKEMLFLVQQSPAVTYANANSQTLALKAASHVLSWSRESNA